MDPRMLLCATSMTTPPPPPTPAARNSLELFRDYIHRLPSGEVDASLVISRECYVNWLAVKQVAETKVQAKRFHRTLTSHLCGTNGRLPFFPEEEAALLTQLRKKASWPCFPSSLAHFGRRFRAVGHHERLQHHVVLQQQQHQHHHRQPHHHGDLAPWSTFSPPTPNKPAAMQQTTMLMPPHSPLQVPSLLLPLPPPPQAPLSLSIHDDDYYLSDDDGMDDSNFGSGGGGSSIGGGGEDDDITQMLLQLDGVDAAYITNLSSHIVQNYAQEFSAKDRDAINDIIRFLVLGRTAKCRQRGPASPQLAQKLCDQHSVGGVDAVLVLDMAGKTNKDRILAQNQASYQALGGEGMLETFGAQLVQRGDLFRTFVAVCGAYHRPGLGFSANWQALTNATSNQSSLYHVTYTVDPRSLLLIVRASSPV